MQWSCCSSACLPLAGGGGGGARASGHGCTAAERTLSLSPRVQGNDVISTRCREWLLSGSEVTQVHPPAIVREKRPTRTTQQRTAKESGDVGKNHPTKKRVAGIFPPSYRIVATDPTNPNRRQTTPTSDDGKGPLADLLRRAGSRSQAHLDFPMYDAAAYHPPSITVASDAGLLVPDF